MSAVPQAQYFDGRSGRGQPVELAIESGCLVARPVAGGADTLRWPLAQVQWPERTRHGQRVLQLSGGGSLQVADAAAFDAWRQGAGLRDTWVVRAQQNWRSTLLAALLLLAVVVAAYRWGVPLAARGVLAFVPADVDRSVGSAALQSIRQRWLKPSALPAARQAALRQALADAVAAAWPAGQRPTYDLHFHDAGKRLGPNAFALPGGSVVITDALVEVLQGADDAVVGVLAHELGHVQHRHGMQALVQFALVSTATGVALGDFSSVLAGASAMVAQMGYSRDAERQADAVAAQVLRASGRSPLAMVTLFERLRASATADEEGSGLGFALASHPPSEERIRYFRDAAAQ